MHMLMLNVAAVDGLRQVQVQRRSSLWFLFGATILLQGVICKAGTLGFVVAPVYALITRCWQSIVQPSSDLAVLVVLQEL